MPRIIDKLKLEHSEFRRFLHNFDEELKKFEKGRSPDYEMLDALLDFFTSFPDEWHHKKEDLVYDALVPKLGRLNASLSDLRAEHQRLETGAKGFDDRIAHLRRGSDLSMKEIVQVGNTYSRLLRHHMVKEDQVFFPLAEEHLIAADWAEIEREILTLRESPQQQAKLERIRRIAGVIEEIAAA